MTPGTAKTRRTSTSSPIKLTRARQRQRARSSPSPIFDRRSKPSGRRIVQARMSVSAYRSGRAWTIDSASVWAVSQPVFGWIRLSGIRSIREPSGARSSPPIPPPLYDNVQTRDLVPVVSVSPDHRQMKLDPLGENDRERLWGEEHPPKPTNTNQRWSCDHNCDWSKRDGDHGHPHDAWALSWRHAIRRK